MRRRLAWTRNPLRGDRLQWHALGMQKGRPTLDGIWEELTARDPCLYAGHYGRAQVLCEKWYGSHGELLAFARQTVAEATPGDAITAILPLAHLEIAWSRHTDSSRPAREVLEAHFKDSYAIGKLIEAADKWRAEPRPHPRAYEAMHLFGATFYYSGHLNRARSLLEGTGNRVPEILPWSAASLTPGRHYKRVRRDLGIA
ncbi:MAG TPA: hypothetical protein VM347_23885 [Nonomuraea sp.]|nr:hypothetical protein [Nonomuraea sp.]